MKNSPELTTLCYIIKDGCYLMMHRVKKEQDINKDKWIGVGGRDGGRIGVAQMTADLKGGVGTTAWNLKVDGANRHRVYCCMPVMDSVPIAPQTSVRTFKAWCAKQPFLKKLVK